MLIFYFGLSGLCLRALVAYKGVQYPMKNIFHIACLLAVLLLPGPGRTAENREVTGAFIQFNRQAAGRSVPEWKALLDRIRAVGIDTIIVQWTAEAPVLYFKDKDLEFKEQFDAVERLMAAERGMRFSVFLGLQHDPAFWNEITARDKALRDYFLVRQAQNRRLQASLLKAFGQRDDWVGYYIPDEIDDLSWRDPARRKLLADYLQATIKNLRDHDTYRTIAISAFFRGRTAPGIAAENLAEVTADAGLDYLLLQDGAGNGDPPEDVLPLYYQALLQQREKQPELWAVLEAFRQTSGPDKPFAAKPAPPDDFARQIKAAAGFKRRILFSFPDYADPERGPEAKALYQSLGGLSGPPNKQE